jgi:hypothetical protein
MLLLKEYKINILPRLSNVRDIQESFNGGGLSGKLDFTGDIDGEGRYLIDNKTASQMYEDDAAETDGQLALYATKFGLTKVAFIVMHKKINHNTVKICKSCTAKAKSSHKTCPEVIGGKRCHGEWDVTTAPEANIQIITSDLKEQTVKMLESALTEAKRGIKMEVFPPNINGCGKVFGKKCPYYNYCWNNNLEGLKENNDD